MKIIMISGKSASGKDTFASILRDELESKNKTVITIHFGDLVKYFAKEYYEWNGAKDEKGRALLQKIGTHQLRRMFPTYWGKVVSQFLASATHDFDYAIIPDWRFINELEMIDKYNSDILTIRINRYNPDGSAYVNPNMNSRQANHISECQLDNFNFEWIVDNIGTLGDLRYAAKQIILDFN